MADQWGGKRKREKSPVIETSEALAFQNIIYQTPSLAIVPVVNFQFTFKELGVLTRYEVLPYVDTSLVKDIGIVKVNSAMFSIGAVEGAKEYNIDLSVEGLRRLVDFPISGDCTKIVLRILGKLSQHFCSTTLVLLAVAHVDPTCAHLLPDWHMFVSSEVRKSLNHEKSDKKSAGKVREGWAAIIELVRNEFMAKQATEGKEPLYLEAKNAFSDTKEELKEELAKAQELVALAERREQTIRLEKDALQKVYSKEKADWESKNHKLVEEIFQLHKDMKKVSTKEELVQAELFEIRSQMEISAKNTGEATELKQELEAKEEEPRKLQEADKKIQQRLKTAKKKGKELEGELKKMPAGVLVKPESMVMELLKSGKKWQLSCYPKVFDAKDLTEWKGSVVPVPCTFCKGLIAPGTDLRIPTYGHSYHISCICSSFGLNHLACWAESCSQTLPTPWIHEFCLDHEVDFEALKERYMCSWDMMSFPSNAELFSTEQDMLHITGVL
ncbi:hypothetical protein R1sor_014668 [Riccia sorocarpa]|uniref:Uncharacterized protein n=1 Tax=Riccia sorocarpa TaxID=122646 RepID=A0ABD3HDX1_9MARC